MSDTFTETASRTEAQAGKYLTFQLGAETYGLTILRVQEIIGMIDVTHVPRTPSFVRGVINLRGRIIPVVDLRIKFGRDACQDTERTCVVVVEVNRDGTPVTMGIIVDEVSEVLEIRAEQMEPPPSFGGCVETGFILGMGKVGQKVVMLLDADRVLSDQDVDSVMEATEAELPA